jgi:hypothetical protein
MRKRTNGLFTLYVWWTHNFRFDEGIPLTTERTRWHKNIKTPQHFIEGIYDCLNHLQDFDFEGDLTTDRFLESVFMEMKKVDSAFTSQLLKLINEVSGASSY